MPVTGLMSRSTDSTWGSPSSHQRLRWVAGWALRRSCGNVALKEQLIILFSGELGQIIIIRPGPPVEFVLSSGGIYTRAKWTVDCHAIVYKKEKECVNKFGSRGKSCLNRWKIDANNSACTVAFLPFVYPDSISFHSGINALTRKFTNKDSIIMPPTYNYVYPGSRAG